MDFAGNYKKHLIMYLHDEADTLHNDFKLHNIILIDIFFANSLNFQIMVIDLGKVTNVEKGR